MNHGLIYSYNPTTRKTSLADENAPLPVVTVGETVAPAAYTSTASYVEVPGARLDTMTSGHKSVGYGCAVVTNNVTVKACGSYDGTIWYDLVAKDKTNADHSAVGVDIAGAASDVLNLPQGAGLTPYRYFTVFAKDTVGATHGVVTVVGFSK